MAVDGDAQFVAGPTAIVCCRNGGLSPSQGTPLLTQLHLKDSQTQPGAFGNAELPMYRSFPANFTCISSLPVGASPGAVPGKAAARNAVVGPVNDRRECAVRKEIDGCRGHGEESVRRGKTTGRGTDGRGQRARAALSTSLSANGASAGALCGPVGWRVPAGDHW